MICLNGRYRMTAESEKVMVEIGGANPNKTISETELSDALCNAINTLAEQKKFHILEKIYRSAVAAGDLPDIPKPEN